MAPPRKQNPYATPDELRAAIKQAGGTMNLALSLDAADGTVRRWCKEMNVDTKAGGGGAPKSDGVALLDLLDDEEVAGLRGVFTYSRIASWVGVTESTIKQYMAARGIGAPTSDVSPRAQMLASRIRKLERDDAAAKELAAAIKYAADTAPAFKPVKRAPMPAKKGRTPVDVILHVSDKQFGELVGPDEVPGGGYSPDIYEHERLPRYVSAAEGILRTVAAAHPIGTLWIAQGGDFVEGEDVYKGQHWHLAMDAGRQVDTIGRLWSTGVAEIATEAKNLGARRVALVSVVGNHGQHGGRKGGSTHATLNYDWLAYQAISLRLQGLPDNGCVDFFDDEARRAVYFNAAGHTVLMTHGDQDRGGGLVGVPVVTGLKNDLGVRMQTEVQHRYHIKGHYHRPTTITVGGSSMTLWNGDWCGANPLSIGRGGGSNPTQHAYVMHPEHALLCSWPIRLADGALPVEVLN